MNTPNIKETKTWSPARVRNCCIAHDFYTCGDNEDYTKMLDTVRELEPTTENLYTIAKDIFDHSDTEGDWEELTISFIMYALNREAVITNYIIEGEERP